MKKILIPLLLLFPVVSFSQSLNPKLLEPTKWKMSLSKQEVKVNETVDIIFTVTIDNEWKLYSLGENPPQATITFDGSGFKTIGNIKEGQGIHSTYDENLEMDVKYFEGKAEFRQTVRILSSNPVINIEVEGQACPKGPGQCVRVNKSFEVNDLKVTAAPNEDKKETGKAIEQPVKPKETSTATKKENSKANASAKSEGNRLSQLEEEKQKLITKNGQGQDETLLYLKNFVQKYGR